MIKLWLEYADLSQDPLEICSFMQVNEIGIKVALFWIAWAFYLEKGGNFKGADKVYLNGIRNLAQPKDILTKRYHQFQRRMTRHFLGGDDDFGLDEIESSAPKFKDANKSSSTILTKFPSKESKQATTAPPVSNSLGFSIFVEDQDPVEKKLPLSWNNLASEQERRKENESKCDLMKKIMIEFLTCGILSVEIKMVSTSTSN